MSAPILNPDWAMLPLFDRSQWKLVRFGDVVEMLKEQVDPASGNVERYVAGEHMETENVHIRKWGTVGDGYLGPAFIRRFRKGQVLYGSRRTYLKKVAMAEFDGVTANTTFVLQADEGKLLQALLPWLMLSERFTEHSIRESKGSTNPYINFPDIAKFEFALPPLDQQRRIAEILWAVDEAQIRASELASCCTELAKVTVASALQLGVGMVHLGDLITEGPQNGLYRPADVYGDGCAILRIDSFYDGRISTTGNLKHVRIDPDDVSRYGLRLDDLLINRVNSIEFVGKCALVEKLDEPTVFESNIMRFGVDRSRIDPKFLVRWMCLDHFRNHIVARAKHAINQASVNQSDIRSASIPLPTISTQMAIMSRVLHFENAASASVTSASDLNGLSTAFVNALWDHSDLYRI